MKPITYTKEELEQLQLVDTTPRHINKSEKVAIKCAKCKEYLRNSPLSEVKKSILKQGRELLCNNCSDLKHKFYTEEELKSYGLTDTTPRQIKYEEIVELKCESCSGLFTNTMRTIKRRSSKHLPMLCKDCGKSKPIFYKKEDLEKLQLVDLTERCIKKQEKVDVKCNKCGDVAYNMLLDSVKRSLKTGPILCKKCANPKGLFYSKEELEQLQLVDTTPRYVKSLDIVAIICSECNKQFTMNFQSAKYRVIRQQDKIKCSNCLSKYITSDGKTVYQLCGEHNKLFDTGLKIFKKHGEEIFKQFLLDEKHSQNRLEQFVSNNIEGIEWYNKQPLYNFPYRPDFKITDKIFLDIDGLYWHSEKSGKPNDYHMTKRKHYENHGFRIIQIREDEIYNKIDIVRSMVYNILGKSSTIYARKCEFKPVTSIDSKKFFQDNHLMGWKSSRPYGLYHDDELVACMSVSIKHDGSVLEIDRFATKLNTHVTGGFSKLLSNILKLFNVQSIISYCDMRYATGDSYICNGFQLINERLGFHWTDKFDTYNRLQCRANMDERCLSAEEYAQEKGWFKIYDAGQVKYEKIISK